jgi:hypothetical protein
LDEECLPWVDSSTRYSGVLDGAALRRLWNFPLHVFALGAAFGVLGMLVAPRVSLPDRIWPANRTT